jgi:K+-sensing histidine kinase KdpD
VLSALEPRIAELDLEAHATLDPATADGDPRLLERLISNLIDNAIRHNTPNGRLQIITRTHDRHAVLSITNTGPTIPPDELDRLFEPFQRLAGRAGHRNGHGLGLAIVRAIAAAHHATLHASPAPGGGLAIEVAFPTVNGPGSKMAPTAPPIEVSGNRRATTIPQAETHPAHAAAPRAATGPSTDRHRPTKAPGGPNAAATDRTRR